MTTIFKFPFSRYVSPYIFRRFDLISHSFKGLRLLIIIESPDGGVLTTYCRILSLLCNQIYQSTRRLLLTTYGFHHTHFLYFRQNVFQKIFCALFWGSRGSCPLFSNSASPATYYHIFSTFRHFFTPFFTALRFLMIIEPPDDRQEKSMSTRTSAHNVWALFGGPRGPCPYFRIPLPRYIYPYFFRRFDLKSHFLLHRIQAPEDY